jgi:hypothetical protein
MIMACMVCMLSLSRGHASSPASIKTGRRKQKVVGHTFHLLSLPLQEKIMVRRRQEIVGHT